MMEKKVGLFEDVKNIKNFECIDIDDEFEIHKYIMDDGTSYSVPSRKANFENINSLMESVFEVNVLTMPSDVYGIEELCKNFLKEMEVYLQLKEFYRFLMVSLGKEEQKNETLQEISMYLRFQEEKIKKNSEYASLLAPSWFGQALEGMPKYSGSNPYNMHGVDHKYDHWIKEEDSYIINRRELYLSIAVSRKPFIPNESDLYKASEFINAYKTYLKGIEENQKKSL